MYLDLKLKIATQVFDKTKQRQQHNAVWKSDDLTKNFNIYSYIAMKALPRKWATNQAWESFATVQLEVTARNNDSVCSTVCLSRSDIPQKVV